MSTLLKTDWGVFGELNTEQRKRYLQFKFLTQINLDRWANRNTGEMVFPNPGSNRGDN